MATIKEKIAAAQAATKAAALSLADAEALADNEALLKAQAEQADAEALARAAHLLKRLIAAQEKYGVDKVRAVAVKGSAHTFIVTGNQAAHAKWEARFSKGLTDPKKHPTAELQREYATECVVDWNGETDFSDRDEHGYKLIKFLTDNAGIVSPIFNACLLLNNFIAEEAKS